jgi:L-alanine-DL-glutamate epimerase-like enolase superfamily enzyme
MRIASIAARAFRWSMASRGAARGRTERAGLVLEVRTDGGLVGLGEAAPLPGTSPDTLDDAARAIDAFARRAPLEVTDRESVQALALACTSAPGAASPPGRTPSAASPNEALMSPPALQAAGHTAAAQGSPAAGFAIETALLDALARHRGVAVSAWLVSRQAGAPGSSAEARSPMPVGPLGRLPLAAVVDDPEEARRAFAAGVRCLKIKLVASDDPARAFAIAAAAPAARLRIDANQSWPRAEVADRLAALAALPIDYVEEPCADCHALVGEPLACKIALDECLATLSREDLLAALRGPALAALVLKPTLLGGFSAVFELARLARGAGVAAIVSHALEGPVGTAACAELALALGGDLPVGLAAHAALAGWRIEVPQLVLDHVQPAPGPGLGFVGLDLAAMTRRAATPLDRPEAP